MYSSAAWLSAHSLTGHLPTGLHLRHYAPRLPSSNSERPCPRPASPTSSIGGATSNQTNGQTLTSPPSGAATHSLTTFTSPGRPSNDDEQPPLSPGNPTRD